MPPISPLFACAWGDIRLFASEITWDNGHTKVVHDLSQGDKHPVQGRGLRSQRARLTLLFDDFTDAFEDRLTRFREFQTAVKNDERRLFTHPTDGAFFAVVGDFEPKIDANSVITASVEFIPDDENEPVQPAGAGTTSTSGEGAVLQAADDMDLALAEAGLGFDPGVQSRIDFSRPVEIGVSQAFSVGASADVNISANVSASASASVSIGASASASASAAASASATAFASAYARASAAAESTAVAELSGSVSVGGFPFAYAAAALSSDARASVESWQEGDEVPTRKVAIDVARLSDSIATMIEAGGLELDLQLWPAFRAAIMFGESIRNAAIAATSETPSVFVMRVTASTALLPLAAKIYGGIEAQDRARQVASLNDIKTQGWLDPGDYLMPVKSRRSR